MSSVESPYTRLLKAVRSAVVSLLLFICACSPSQGQHQGEQPFIFGVLTDVHYADKESNHYRFYRTALRKLDECVADLNRRRPAFVIQLGDIVDGDRDNVDELVTDLDSVLQVYNGLMAPKYHVVGNHCLLVGEEVLRQKLHMERFYYDFSVPSVEGWRFVVLDGNATKDVVTGRAQLEWFRSTLDKAARNGEKVICFCHYPLLEAAAARHRMMANPEPFLKAMDDAHCVAAWFAGHYHAGGYAIRNGVHHVTLKAMIEAPVHTAYALIELHADRIREIGIGSEPSRDLPLEPRESALKTERPAEPDVPARADKPGR
jgi:hypothetical protein